MPLSSINPKLTKTWPRLQAHFNEIKEDHFYDYFKKDDGRADKFSISWNRFYFDFSKNKINVKTISLFEELLNEINFKSSVEKYFSGEKINTTESRSVLHTALRADKDDKIFVDDCNIVAKISEAKNKMRLFTESILSGSHEGFKGDKIDTVVNIGIGGSDLGPSMVIESLRHYKNHINTYFISNVDGDHVRNILQKINPETTLFIIVSKTFTTIETLENAKKIRKWFIDKANVESIKDHFIAVSNNTEAPKDFGILPVNVLSIPEWVGGRFSLWGSVGLIISIVIGSKNFKEFLKGAESMDLHFRNSPFEKNIPVILALISIWYNNFFKCETEAVLPYNQFLGKLPDYLQQASMESNGKGIDRSGNKINYETGSIIWGSTGTNAQHAFFQLMHQGTKIIPSDFIAFKKSLYGDKAQHDILTSNFLAQTNALMMGKITNRIENHKNIDGNKPSNSIVINKLSPSNLGALISMYENKIFTIGSILNIYSYDQWGVELGKSIAKDISKGKQDNLDQSTIKISEILKK